MREAKLLGSGPFQVSQVQLTLLLHPLHGARLKTCVFFPVVGSTIRRCTKLFALSRLHWALERTAHTGWHARFGSSRTHRVANPLCPLLRGILPNFLLFLSSPLPSDRLAWPLGSRNSGQRMTTPQSQGTK